MSPTLGRAYVGDHRSGTISCRPGILRDDRAEHGFTIRDAISNGKRRYDWKVRCPGLLLRSSNRFVERDGYGSRVSEVWNRSIGRGARMRAETPTNTCSDLGLSFGRSKPNVPIGAGTAAYIFLVLGSVATVAIWPASATTLVVAVAIVLFVSKLTGRRIVDAGGGVVIAATGWLIRADFSGLTPGYLVIGLAAAALSFLPLANWRRQPGRFPVLGIFCAVQGVY